MRVEMQQVITIGLNRYDHAGKGLFVRACFAEEVLDCLVKALAKEAEELAVVLEEDAEHFRDSDDVLPDRHFFQDFLLDALGEQNDPLLVAGWAEVSSLAGKREQVLATAGAAPDAREAVAQVAAVEKFADHAADNWTPVSVKLLVTLLINPFEFFEVVFDAGVEVRRLRVSGTIDPLQPAIHRESNCRLHSSAKIIGGSSIMDRRQ